MKQHKFTISIPCYAMLIQIVADNKRIALAAIRHHLALSPKDRIHIVDIT